MSRLVWRLFPEWAAERQMLAAEATRLGVRVRWYWSCNRLLRALGAVYVMRRMTRRRHLTRVRTQNPSRAEEFHVTRNLPEERLH